MSRIETAPWEALYDSAARTFQSIAHDTLANVLAELASTWPDSVVIRYFDDATTAAELDEIVDRLARALVSRGLARGDRVALFTQNDPHYVVGLLATWRCGGVAVACSPLLTRKELTAQLNDSGAAVLIALDSLYSSIGRDAADDASVPVRLTCSPLDFLTDTRSAERWNVVEDETALPWAQMLEEDHHEVALHGAARGDVALLTYTSGTTGPPKGAMSTHANILHVAAVGGAWMDMGPKDSILAIAPLFHVTGLFTAACALAKGSTLHLSHRFDADEQLRIASRYRPTVSVGPSTAYIALMERARGDAASSLSSLVKAFAGGAPLPPAVSAEWARLTGSSLHNAYGLTETTSASHMTPLSVESPTDPTTGVISMGLPVMGTSSRIVDEKGQAVAVGEIGEIGIRGPQVVPGYWNKPDESSATFVDGELRTGDIGFMNHEGWFFVVDRKKDLIVASGFKIWPRDVEDALYEHPAVREVAVVGVPDDYRGETVKAFVSLKPDRHATADELMSFAGDRLASYKRPRLLTVLDDLPKTGSGKILRRELKQLASLDDMPSTIDKELP